MSINNTISSEKLNEDIDNLSKNLYLESPDLWIDFSDKMGDKIFDEMVLFFATKYKYLSIVKHAVDNNLIDLDSPSKNKSFNSIRNHLISIVKQNNSTDIYNYLTSQNEEYEETSNILKNYESNTEIKENSYNPTFICPHCNTNIFDTGYISLEETTYKYSKNLNKIIETSNKILDSVTCNNCKKNINNTNPKLLENLCTVQNCSKCGLDLTSTGIIDKAKMIYNKDLNKFVNSYTSYHCSSCDKELNKYQIEHFNLKL